MGISIIQQDLVPVRRDGQVSSVTIGGGAGGGGLVTAGLDGSSGTSGTSGTSGSSGISGQTFTPFYYDDIEENLHVPKISVNNIIIDSATGLTGTHEYYVATSSGGSPTTKLTFINGILTSET